MKKILLIEDDKEIAESISNALIINGYVVCTASSGNNAKESHFNYKPDLIISDILMSGMNGIGLLELIRQDLRYFNLPFILLSDATSEKQVVNGRNIGTNMCLKKSCNLDELVFSVSQLLKQI